MKIGANGMRFSRGVSHALARREPSMSLQHMIEERSCQWSAHKTGFDELRQVT